jgi:hypothetical protein
MLPWLVGFQDPPSLPKAQGDTIPTLELKADPSIKNGQVAAIEGTVGPNGLRFVVGELSILQPILVTLVSRDESDDLTLSLFKKDWTNVRRTASTRGSGMARFEFRTQGGVNILVRGSATPTPFALVVWAGDEMHTSMPDVVVTHDEFRKRNPDASAKLSASGENESKTPRTFSVTWIALLVVGGAAGFITLRTLGRRKEA